MKGQPKQPSANDFIEFSLYGGDHQTHPVYKWLSARRSYQDAERKFSRSDHYKSLRPESLRLDHVMLQKLPMQPGLQQTELLDFAQKVSYCFGHYYAERDRPVWRGSSSRERKAAGKTYQSALDWSCKGFGPYVEEDRRRLEELLQSARDYVLGKHLIPAFRLKGGNTRQIAMLIRELAAILNIRFNLQPPLLSSIIKDLCGVTGERIGSKTVQRNIRATKPHHADRTDP